MSDINTFPEGLSPLNDLDRVIHAPPRLTILAYLYVIESADFVFLMRLCELTWGNLSSHLSKLEEAGYVSITKTFVGKRPHTMIRLTKEGRTAFQAYKSTMQQILEELP